MPTYASAVLATSLLLSSGALRACNGGSTGGTPTTTSPAVLLPAAGICDTTPLDNVSISDAWLDGDELHATLTYSGGCGDHDFDPCWNGMWLKSDPMQVDLAIVHNANGDMCKALLTEEHVFDVSTIAADTLGAWPGEDGVWLNVGDEQIWYAF